MKLEHPALSRDQMIAQILNVPLPRKVEVFENGTYSIYESPIALAMKAAAERAERAERAQK